MEFYSSVAKESKLSEFSESLEILFSRLERLQGENDMGRFFGLPLS